MSSQDTDAQDELEPVSFQPLPNIITAFSADASPFEALSESVDNSIDHVRSRAYDGYVPEDDLQINVRFEAGESLEDCKIVVEDNAGGVSGDNLSRFFQWGASDTAPESIGRFGVGASRIAALGGVISYQSRAQGQPTGYGFEVDVSEMESHEGEVTDETYQASRKEIEDLDEGHTRIEIKDLKRNIVDILGVEPDSGSDMENYDELSEVPEEKWEKAVNKLANQFGDYFERYITQGISFEADYFPIDAASIDVSIEVELDLDDTTISRIATPPEKIEYSYVPFDSLSPRRYEGLPFDENEDVPSEDAAIRADIEVGLMLNSADEKAGLTLYANDRKILSRDTSNPLFSSDYLGRYRSESGHSRLSIEVELNGDIAEMPVNSLKSDLDMNSPISDPLLRIVKNAAKRYRKQTYSSMPGWILNVYEQDHPFAANGGDIREFDKRSAKTNSARFRSQPGNGSGRRMFPERDRLRSIVKIHRTLRIRDDTYLLPKEVPAYERYFSESYAKDVDDSDFTLSEPVEVEGPDLDWGEISITADEDDLEVISTIKWIAERHYDAGGRADETGELQAWQVPRYREELRRLTGQVNLDDTSLTIWDEIPENQLILALGELGQYVGKEPSEEDMDSSGPYASDVYLARFGSWEDALIAAGFRESTEGEERTDSSVASPEAVEPRRERSEETAASTEETSGFGSSEPARSQSAGETVSRGAEAEPSTEIQGTGIVVQGEYYQISEEDQELLNELVELTDDTDPEDAWETLKDVLEWYQQMPNR